MLCLNEKLAIPLQKQYNILNKRTKILIKCRHSKNYSLANYDTKYGNERTFYPYSIEINKSSGSYNNINNPYAHLCVSDVVKNMNVKLLNLMLRTNDGRCIKWYETCKYKWILDESVYNKKKRWNNDKCRCKCKELIDNGSCNKGFIWNLSNCECECHKLCDVAEYFDYKNYKCSKMLID